MDDDTDEDPYDCARISVPINACTARELAKQVPGIGAVLSNRIVEERKKNDWFSSWEDLQRRVYGIGPKLIEKMQKHDVDMMPMVFDLFDSESTHDISSPPSSSHTSNYSS